MTGHLTVGEYRKLRGQEPKPNKYHAQRTWVCKGCGRMHADDGGEANCHCGAGFIMFHSKREAEYYLELRMMQRINVARGIVLQPAFEFNIGGKKMFTYKADFSWIDTGTGFLHIVDVKSVATRTPLYRLKKKIIEASHGIKIEEVF